MMKNDEKSLKNDENSTENDEKSTKMMETLQNDES
jgi:hypothetical protein